MNGVSEDKKGFIDPLMRTWKLNSAERSDLSHEI
jgi:hypothetical protein